MEAIDTRSNEELVNAIALAQHTVYKRYLSDIQMYPLVQPTVPFLDENARDCVRFFQLEELSCKRGEDIFQKLSTVYYASMSLGCSLVVMIDVEKIDAPAKIYIGVRNSGEDKEALSRLGTSFQTLKNGLKSNFPGTKVRDMSSQESMPRLVEEIFGDEAKYITSVSGVASVRDKSKTENKVFIQGIERFIDVMRGQTYTALFIAEPITVSEQKAIRSGYENLYSTLSSFQKSVWSYNENESRAVMESLSDGISKSVSDGTSCTQAHTKNVGVNMGFNIGNSTAHSASTSHANPTKAAMAVNVIGKVVPLIAGAINPLAGMVASGVANVATAATQGRSITQAVTDTIARTVGMNLGLNAGYASTKSETESHTSTDTTTQTKTTGTTTTTGTGRTLQIETVNKPIQEMLVQIEEQLKRVKEGEDYGAYSCGAYFLSGKEASSLLAANTYRALMIGEGASAESGAINAWNGLEEPEKVSAMKEYLKRFAHPVFAMALSENAESMDDFITYTPGTVVSGLELPLHLGLPTKSVYGLPVLEYAEFGRNVITYNRQEDIQDNLHIGKIYYMNQAEKAPVSIFKESLSSHVFVTGSTGSGKSNTVYQILNQAREHGVKFLVVEPAKGEYKSIFGTEEDVNIYGTNPAFTPLLRIDPFRFPKEIHVFEHLDRLVEIFNVCWPMYAAMPAVLKNAIEQSYTDCGWDLVESVNPYGDELYPTFADVARNIKSIIDSSEYDTENKGAYKGALLTRLQSLTNGINGLIFTTDEIPPKKLFDENVVIDLSRVGSSETKSLIMGMMVLKLSEYRMTNTNGMNCALQHLTVLEEAHNLLKRSSVEGGSESSNLLGKSVEMIANAIAEMRTYGEGFMIVDQAPGLLDMAAIRNTNTKIIMRLPDQNDRELVGKAANLNDNQITELAKLPCGVAAIYQNEWIEPVLCKVNQYDTAHRTYQYEKTEKVLKENDIDRRVHIADLLSHGTKIHGETGLREYRKELAKLRLDASLQVLVIKMLANPPKEPRMTKLAPVMNALFPSVTDAVRKSALESSDASEWNQSAEDALCTLGVSRIDDLVRRDIIQCAMTYYFLIELNDESKLQEWTARGGLK